jgi:hypothetical protein
MSQLNACGAVFSVDGSSARTCGELGVSTCGNCGRPRCAHHAGDYLYRLYFDSNNSPVPTWCACAFPVTDRKMARA